ncbi:hypothetical protein GCM10019016_061230 [Streptomyces prasinosporus]|uniref:Uncharacterized protein n=1 Tax=Streptomyces prasinosporus TaxID=68256 RepID=A0ABP6TVZ9_9ACTN|nr:hypothetical protein GCM10010332_70850 [Streptomyces albogriseolus]GHG05223.1 hypothetical protein GCM10018777_15890 [Streptomyces viridodiastaticus]
MTKGRTLIDATSLFSAPAGQTRSSTGSPPPTTQPFQAPDFGEEEIWAEDAEEPAPDTHAVRPRSA